MEPELSGDRTLAHGTGSDHPNCTPEQDGGWRAEAGRGSLSVGGAVIIGTVECSPGFKACGPAKCPPTGVAGWSRLRPTLCSVVGDHASTTGGDMAVAPALPFHKRGRAGPPASRRRVRVRSPLERRGCPAG